MHKNQNNKYKHEIEQLKQRVNRLTPQPDAVTSTTQTPSISNVIQPYPSINSTAFERTSPNGTVHQFYTRQYPCGRIETFRKSKNPYVSSSISVKSAAPHMTNDTPSVKRPPHEISSPPQDA